jgi:hypothetical protein
MAKLTTSATTDSTTATALKIMLRFLPPPAEGVGLGLDGLLCNDSPVGGNLDGR